MSNQELVELGVSFTTSLCFSFDRALRLTPHHEGQVVYGSPLCNKEKNVAIGHRRGSPNLEMLSMTNASFLMRFPPMKQREFWT